MSDKEMHEIQARASLDLADKADNPEFSKYFYRLAIDHCDRGLKLDAKDIGLCLLRARAHVGLGDYQAALQVHDYAIRLHDEIAELYFTRALTHERMGALDKAKTDCRKALELAKEQGQTELAEVIQKYSTTLDKSSLQ